MDVPLNQKQLIAIEFPGTVNNVFKMVGQLGGPSKLDATFRDPLKRLELYPRPGDPYSKPIHGDKFNTTAFMMEIVKRKKKSTGEVTYQIKYHGSVATIYKFKSICDFQILPLAYDKDGQNAESLLPKIVPCDLHLSDWLDEDVPLFIAPLMFSRFDMPQNGYIEVTKPRNSVKEAASQQDSKLISRTRPKRNTNTLTVSFESRDVIAPKMEIIADAQLHPVELAIKEKVAALFEERPIWTKNAISSMINCDKGRLTRAMANLAYFFANGPWRTLWVKFGHDPRKDPKSKIYQLMDFRIQQNIKLDENSGGRTRSMDFYTPPSKSSQRVSLRVPTIQADHFLGQGSSQQNKSKESLSDKPHYMYIPGRIPCIRQCYFQLCDILLDEVQELVHMNDGKEQFCHEKDGWCEIGVLDKCREIIMRDIKETAKLLDQERV